MASGWLTPRGGNASARAGGRPDRSRPDWPRRGLERLPNTRTRSPGWTPTSWPSTVNPTRPRAAIQPAPSRIAAASSSSRVRSPTATGLSGSGGRGATRRGPFRTTASTHAGCGAGRANRPRSSARTTTSEARAKRPALRPRPARPRPLLGVAPREGQPRQAADPDRTSRAGDAGRGSAIPAQAAPHGRQRVVAGTAVRRGREHAAYCRHNPLHMQL